VALLAVEDFGALDGALFDVDAGAFAVAGAAAGADTAGFCDA
jgi:hypothetical protein